MLTAHKLSIKEIDLLEMLETARRGDVCRFCKYMSEDTPNPAKKEYDTRGSETVRGTTGAPATGATWWECETRTGTNPRNRRC